MNRRQFLELSLRAGGCCLLSSLPRFSYAAPLDDVIFSHSVYGANRPQTIMIFLYGGASELAGNFTNFEQFRDRSQNSYSAHFGSGNLEKTASGFWEYAGGTTMESMLSAGDLNVFRTCFSQVRWDNGNRSHGSCVSQNQRGSFTEDAPGIFANLGRVLQDNGIIDGNTRLPFISMEGDSQFYATGNLVRVPILEPVSITENLDNPFRRGSERSYSEEMDRVAQLHNPEGKIKDAFAKRQEMEDFIVAIDELPDPELGVNDYENDSFAEKLKTAIKILNYNSDTQIISLGTSGLGGWDDHNDAENYPPRMDQLFLALKSAMAHIHSIGKAGKINLMVMGDFGRGVNLNSANGWDHGNLQTFYVMGGTSYFSNPGIVGTTVLEDTGSVNRLFLRPASSSYWFEPLSVASTIYLIYGITNPEVLTGGVSPIDPLV